MGNKILITSDSTTDLSPELRSKNGIVLMHLAIQLGDKEYRDGVDITPEEIYKNYEETGELPKTSATGYAEGVEFFKQFVDQGYEIVHFTISSEMSSTYHTMCMAAENFENVYVVDTRNLSTGGGLLVMSAVKLREEGYSAKEIAEKCREIAPRVDASFIIDNLEFLHKGGRCSAVAAFGANLLSLKPCIAVENGKMGVKKKYRGKFEIVLKQYIRDRIGDASDIEKDIIFVTHAGCEDRIAQDCAELVKTLGDFKNLYITRAGCSVSSHCGKNTLGVLFIRNHPIVQ
ncbi:MAG: DegV family protein [Clostridia bacterium]|nr:DegV family protein [Clostridia bacterium]